MPRPKTKADLIKQAEKNFEKLLATLKNQKKEK